MNRKVLRRGLAVAASGMALAGIVAAGQPAGAATAKDGPAPTHATSLPDPAPSLGTRSTTASTPSARNAGGVGVRHLDGACNVGDLCLWWGYNYYGSHADFYWADNNLNNDYFNSPGGGQGQRVGNNARSYANYDHYLTARAFTNTNYTGASVNLYPWTGNNFPGGFADNVESFYWTF
ncbi:conserved exported hypothetical protein [Frankia canadensis]|uniref:Peptidase inhibitor family I36 n=1 Tax=Frankia canadensis TaxID=1836972 RepID=A0A2I2KIW4_9ACTN|nr:peptidase inhibitor family I36 protein [Frankia canadensis]SNQ45603.1 conserved exported hypothetical protein [Frankia canadensis]SOU52893.1 conserved exported hypothetical protein [Frankia canadensis]